MKVTRRSSLRIPLRIIGCALILCAIPAFVSGQNPSDGGPPKPGCPFKIINQKVQSVFGAFDRSLHNGGEVEGGEIPNVIKVESVTIYSCVFQRNSTREVLTFTAFFYPTAQEASAALERAAKASNSAGPFYTSASQQSGVQLREGPGRIAAARSTQVVIVHWMTVQGSRPIPKDIPGSRLEPIVMSWIAK